MFRPLLCLVLFPCQDPSAADAGSNLLVFHFALKLWRWPSVLPSPPSQCSPSYSPTEPSKESHKNCTKKAHKTSQKLLLFYFSSDLQRFFCRPAAEWLEIVRRSLFYAGEPPEASLASPVFHHHFDRLRLRHLIQIYYLRGSHLLIS